MDFLNALLTGLFDVLFLPLRPLGPWPAMIAVSLLTGGLMLAVFRWTSNQAGIRRAKDLIKAHLLEIRLYRDNLGQSFRSQGGVLAANARYFGYAVKPMLVMIVPVMLILVQLDLRFGSRALRVGEEAMVRVRLAHGADPLTLGLEIEAPAAIAVTTPALRIPEAGEIDWRLRPARPGRETLVFRWPGGTAAKSIAVETAPLAVISGKTTSGGWLDRITHPGEKSLPRGGPIASIEIVYPETSLGFFGIRMHWLVAYFGLSILLGLAFKGVFKVEV